MLPVPCHVQTGSRQQTPSELTPDETEQPPGLLSVSLSPAAEEQLDT